MSGVLDVGLEERCCGAHYASAADSAAVGLTRVGVASTVESGKGASADAQCGTKRDGAACRGGEQVPGGADREALLDGGKTVDRLDS